MPAQTVAATAAACLVRPSNTAVTVTAAQLPTTIQPNARCGRVGAGLHSSSIGTRLASRQDVVARTDDTTAAVIMIGTCAAPGKCPPVPHPVQPIAKKLSTE